MSNVISRRVLDFVDDARSIQEMHTPKGFTRQQFRAIADLHGIRLTFGALRDEGFVNVQLGSDLIRMKLRTRQNGLIIVCDRVDRKQPMQLSRKHIQQVLTNPRTLYVRDWTGKNPVTCIAGKSDSEHPAAM